jgi:predicted Rossmann fold nucleotide-binding protein DprA/Smf involved in DNA uptake
MRRFPARNRIIAGLCRATIVVEARERSGALITADFALEEGRDVLAVPGEITSALSGGTNALLRLGAAPVTCPADVLELYDLAPGDATAQPVGNAARALLERLSGGGVECGRAGARCRYRRGGRLPLRSSSSSSPRRGELVHLA